MICAIIPYNNDGSSIKKVINQVSSSRCDKIIIVENGSTDKNIDILKSITCPKVEITFINIPLGYDIPRAIGLSIALLSGGDGFIFLDSDMTGIKKDDINMLINALNSGIDLALTDCYPNNKIPSGLAGEVLKYRKALNERLGIFNQIGYSTPSHGPHAISKKIALELPIYFTAVPPLLLSFCCRNNYTIKVALSKTHKHLGSKNRSDLHSIKMAETIIGDSICAINYYNKGLLSRKLHGKKYIGYHNSRRFDVLNLILRDLFSKFSY